VPVSECTTQLHQVVHTPTKRTASYGSLAQAAGKLPVPKPEDLRFKTKDQWRYIAKQPGTQPQIADLADILTGKAIFGMDARRPGMVYASVEHPPVMGGIVQSFDDKEARQVKGVSDTMTIPPFKPPYTFQPLGGVAVIANSTWAAFQARKKLKVEWGTSDHSGDNAAYDSEQYKKELLATAQKPGKVVRNVGNVEAAFSSAASTHEASYYVPLLAHATMEPPVAVAEYRDGKVEVWAPT